MYIDGTNLHLRNGQGATDSANSLGNLINIRPSGFLRFIVDVSLILIFSISVWFWFFAG